VLPSVPPVLSSWPALRDPLSRDVFLPAAFPLKVGEVVSSEEVVRVLESPAAGL